jgi:hypothetical protein
LGLFHSSQVLASLSRIALLKGQTVSIQEKRDGREYLENEEKLRRKSSQRLSWQKSSGPCEMDLNRDGYFERVLFTELEVGFDPRLAEK